MLKLPDIVATTDLTGLTDLIEAGDMLRHIHRFGARVLAPGRRETAKDPLPWNRAKRFANTAFKARSRLLLICRNQCAMFRRTCSLWMKLPAFYILNAISKIVYSGTYSHLSSVATH